MMLRLSLLLVALGAVVVLARTTLPATELASRGNAYGAGGGQNNDNEGYQNGNGNDQWQSDGSDGQNGNGGSGTEAGNGGDGGNGSNGASAAEIDRLIGNGQQNKVINLGTKFLGTQKSFSQSSNVVKSRKDNYFRKNFVNEVVSNLRLLRKKVNVHKHITYKRPLTVDNIKVHQQTNYIENVYPQLNKLYVKEYGTVVQPSRLITIQRSQDSSRRNVNHRLQVNTATRNVNLGTRFEKTVDLGVRNFGNTGFGAGAGGAGGGNGFGGGNGNGSNNNGQDNGNNGGDNDWNDDNNNNNNNNGNNGSDNERDNGSNKGGQGSYGYL